MLSGEVGDENAGGEAKYKNQNGLTVLTRKGGGGEEAEERKGGEGRPQARGAHGFPQSRTGDGRWEGGGVLVRGTYDGGLRAAGL